MKRASFGSILGAVLACFAGIAMAGTNTWTSLGSGNVFVSIQAFIKPDPTTPLTIYAGVDSQPGRLLKSTDGGTTWNAILTSQNEFLDLVAAPQAPQTIYASAQGLALYKSTDGGAHWTMRNIGLTADAQGLVIDPATPTTLYAHSYDGVFKTIDGAGTWVRVLSESVNTLVIDPANRQVLYAGSSPNRILKSTNGGASWTSIASPVYSAYAMIIDLGPPSTLYVAASLPGGVYKSTDGGATWTSTNATRLNSPNSGMSTVRQLALVPGTTPALFATTQQGSDCLVYRSLDGGATWINASSGLPLSNYCTGTQLSNNLAAPQVLFAAVGGFATTFTHDASLLTPTCTLSASPSVVPDGGGTSALTAYCTPTPTSFDWSSNTGFATSASGGTVSLTQTTTYTVQGVNGNGSSNVASVTVFVPSPRLINISTRAKVLTLNEVLIGGFIIEGSTPKTVVVRARGPSLAALGAPNTLANPTLRLMSGQTTLSINDDWQTASNAAELQASGFAPSNSLESAVMMTVNPGAYTAIVSGSDGGTGMGIVEVFEVDHPEVPLINISARGSVLTGDDVMIGGFIIRGNGPQTVVVRARGPSMAQLGLLGTIADPMLRLYAGDTLIETNDNWIDAANAAQVQSSGFAPADSRESAILITLNPGAYTAIMSGVGNTTGIGIVEVFAAP